MDDLTIERHPLEPFLPEGTQLLMLGSFPPARKRWCMDFFYPNFTNDMWRIWGLLLHEDKDHFVDKEHKTFRQADIMAMLNEKRIGIYDTATAVCRTRNTAADKDLQVVEPTDMDALLERIPKCRAIVTTGEKATGLLCEHFGIRSPKVGSHTDFTTAGRPIRLYRMPSSSRAYPMKIERKAEFYSALLAELE